jgi:hypothetical protein
MNRGLADRAASRDLVLTEMQTQSQGPKFSRHERAKINLRRFYAVSQIEYCRNFIFKRSFPIHRIFERGCEIGPWRLTADKSPRSSAGG